jgi:hypothetical protein
MLLIGWPLGLSQRGQQQPLGGRVRDRMRGLGEHRGRSGQQPRHSFHHRDRGVGRQCDDDS